MLSPGLKVGVQSNGTAWSVTTADKHSGPSPPRTRHREIRQNLHLSLPARWRRFVLDPTPVRADGCADLRGAVYTDGTDSGFIVNTTTHSGVLRRHLPFGCGQMLWVSIFGYTNFTVTEPRRSSTTPPSDSCRNRDERMRLLLFFSASLRSRAVYATQHGNLPARLTASPSGKFDQVTALGGLAALRKGWSEESRRYRRAWPQALAGAAGRGVLRVARDPKAIHSMPPGQRRQQRQRARRNVARGRGGKRDTRRDRVTLDLLVRPIRKPIPRRFEWAGRRSAGPPASRNDSWARAHPGVARLLAAGRGAMNSISFPRSWSHRRGIAQRQG